MSFEDESRPDGEQVSPALIVDMQAVCRELRGMVERISQACEGIETLNPLNTHTEVFAEGALSLQQAFNLAGPCMQKFIDVADKHERRTQ